MSMAAAWVLQQLPGMGLARKHQLLAAAPDMQSLIHAEALAPLFHTWHGSVDKALNVAQREIDAAMAMGVQLIAWQTAEYPALLATIYDPPFILYAKGQLQLLKQQPKVAVVGPRKADAYGLQVTRQLSQALAEAGVVVVSGMAAGVDTQAHLAALPHATIAVLGCGIDVIYPRQNRQLYQRLCQEALVLSEFKLATAPLAAHFPQRNRLVSGLCDATLVTQADHTSGALITARFALEQGRDVFAVPQSIFIPQGRGANAMLRDGAAMVLDATDILSRLPGLKTTAKTSADKKHPHPKALGLSGEESLLLQELQSSGDSDIDMIAQRCGLPLPTVLMHLSSLEIKGLIRKQLDGSLVVLL